MRKLYLVLLLVLLPAVLPRIRHVMPHMELGDFVVYDTASVLAREHRGAAIYDGADTGEDPQKRVADPRTLFAATARQLGAPETDLYVYPPILADMMIPLSFLPLKTAEIAWTVLNYVCLAAVIGLLINLLRIPWKSIEAVTLAVALFCAQPFVSCILWGQITLFLALLWLLGMWLYREGWLRTSAALFALAATIKIVPLIAVVPFVIWKEFRWVRAFLATLLVLVGGMYIFNGPSTLADFAFHVMPPMSHGIADLSNQTLLCAVQLVYQLAHRGDIILGSPIVPNSIIFLGKVCSLLVLILAMKPLVEVGARMKLESRLLALFFLYMISNPIAPVTWAHGYIPTVIGLAVCWLLAFRRGIGTPRLLLLCACTVSVTSFVIHTGMAFFLKHGRHDVLAVALSIFTPLAIVLLSLIYLESLKREEAFA